MPKFALAHIGDINGGRHFCAQFKRFHQGAMGAGFHCSSFGSALLNHMGALISSALFFLSQDLEDYIRRRFETADAQSRRQFERWRKMGRCRRQKERPVFLPRKMLQAKGMPSADLVSTALCRRQLPCKSEPCRKRPRMPPPPPRFFMALSRRMRGFSICLLRRLRSVTAPS